jgi:hypothetical protein
MSIATGAGPLSLQNEDDYTPSVGEVFVTALLQNDAALVRDIASKWQDVKNRESEARKHEAEQQKAAHTDDIGKQFTLLKSATRFRYILSGAVVLAVVVLSCLAHT